MLLCKIVFTRCQMPKEDGAAKLVVLLNVDHLNMLLNSNLSHVVMFFYKYMTKLLRSRMKDVLPHLINSSQGAFIQGREPLFNILIYQDRATGYTRRHV